MSSKRLTEEMVVARTKISDLSKIKRLNCWGSELVDVSLLRKMPAVEVLSLSINKIHSLADFQVCKRLEELYIRQNDIRDLNEVVYLQNLPNLKNLWLGENPCANSEGYRLAVIKALPQIQKLDNQQVTQDELRDAQRRGKTLVHPHDQESEDEEEVDEEVEYVPAPQYNRYKDYSETESSPIQRQETEYEAEESEDCYPREEVSEASTDPLRLPSPTRRPDVIQRAYSPEPEIVERRKSSYEQREIPRQQYYEKSPTTTNSYEESSPTVETVFREPNKLVNSQSANCIKDYTNGDRFVPANYRQEGDASTQGQERSRERHSCSAGLRPPFNRRPVTRNSNILSAVLCLVKELDYPSLEVVEMTVRCRMDELDE